MKLNDDLLKILACPACKSPVNLKGEGLACQNASCGLVYPIREGIPVMLIEEARKS
jgi:uncharacterized protein